MARTPPGARSNRKLATERVTSVREDPAQTLDPRAHRSHDLDVADQQRTARLLWRSESVLAQAGTMAHLGAWEVVVSDPGDLNAGTLWWSYEVYRIFGYEPGGVAVTNALFFERVHPDDRSKVAEAVARAIAEKKPYVLEHRVVRPGGAERVVLEHAHITFDDRGRPFRIVGAVQDITVQREVEQALLRAREELEARVRERTAQLQETNRKLAESQARFDLVLERSPVVLSEQDRELRYTWFCNPSPGLTEAAVLGRTDWDLYPPEEAARITALKRRAIDACEVVRAEVAGTLAGKHLRHDMTIHPLREADGSIVGVVSAAVDVTELRRSEARLRALAAELTEAEERERRRIAHLIHEDLQQTMAAARFHGGSLRNRLAAEPLRVEMDLMLELLGRSIGIARSLAVELMPPVLHDAPLVSGLDWLSRWMRDQHGLTVTVSATDIHPRIPWGLKVMLFRAVQELLLNVTKHSGATRACVELTHDPHSGEVSVVVSDEGAGFESATVPSETKAGRGLGLFQLGERLTHAGGRMEIDSAPGRGTRIALTVPHRTEAGFSAAGSEEEPLTSQTENRAPGAKGPIRILVVDDHTIVRQGLVELLRRETDIEIAGEASDGREAIDLTRKIRPAVVLMDVAMPHMNGIEATEIITSEMPRVRVVGLSMHSGDDIAARMRGAGAVGYVVKDGPIAGLLAAIREAAAGAA